MQYDAMDDLYDFHAQMEVHEEVPMEVQITQPQMDQQQPNPPQELHMVILGLTFKDLKPPAIMLPSSRHDQQKGKGWTWIQAYR